MKKVNGGVACGVWIMDGSSPVEDARKTCVLAAGHYLVEDIGGGPGGAESWHSDCPYVAGQEHPEPDQHRHDHTCFTWADYANGAHPSDVVLSDPVDEDEVPVPVAVGESGRTLTDLGDYTAQVRIGGASVVTTGPARMVSAVIRAFADAFEEEAER